MSETHQPDSTDIVQLVSQGRHSQRWQQWLSQLSSSAGREDELEHVNSLASILLSLDLPHKSIDLLTTVLKRNPIQVTLLNNLGHAYVMVGDYDQALDVFHQALELQPEDYRLLKNLGVTYLRANDPDGAIEYLSRVVEFDDTLADAVYYLGCAYEQKGCGMMALRYLQRAVEIDGENLEYLLRLANLYETQESFLPALAALNRAADLVPALAPLYFRLGRCYLATGQRELACGSLKQYLEIGAEEPWYRQAEQLLAMLTTKDKGPSEAVGP